ncbi:MAG TPA: hypothetical protein VH054_18230, partial [Polyangiaceae bacterium]|nr:hypothetical protein [Polyangiaceae bacterium]
RFMSSSHHVAAVASASARAVPLVHVPRAVSPIKIDAETEEKAWVQPPGPARTGELLLENGKPARPHTEARLVWSDDGLYMAVLASDEDIRSQDFLHVVITRGGTDYAIDVYATGAVKTAVGGVQAVVDADGVIDNPKGFDEEWNIEMLVPFASLGTKGEHGVTLGLALGRCDTPKTTGVEVCASLRDTLVLE